ncbi:HlyD family secretion protein [Klebsiella sp. B345]|uniref:HlyD family secretion protein n=1 Tax=Klebsiella sp. B345 TaxID=2755398 RepID=UPI003DAA0241
MCKLIVRFFLGINILFVLGCDNKSDNMFSGYSHGNFVYLSSSSNAKIEHVLVKKGDLVKDGQALVKLESFDALNILQRAEEKLKAEHALLRNLASGERPEQLNIIRSQLKKARSSESQVKRQLERYRDLYAKQAISVAEWENIRDDFVQKSAQVEELVHQLEARQLPARQDEIEKQQSQVKSAQLERDKASWDVQQTTLFSPLNAQVFDIIYRAGERSTVGRPIISLLPPDNIKVRFFVPEAILGKFKTGMSVKLLCDGCSTAIPGTINYISPEAEFTPPVIYSTNRREKLIYMIEAVPDREYAMQLRVGQPFSVETLFDE